MYRGHLLAQRKEYTVKKQTFDNVIAVLKPRPGSFLSAPVVLCEQQPQLNASHTRETKNTWFSLSVVTTSLDRNIHCVFITKVDFEQVLLADSFLPSKGFSLFF